MLSAAERRLFPDAQLEPQRYDDYDDALDDIDLDSLGIDTLPAIGSPRGHPGLVLAFGHGHNGMTSGPVTGRLVADLVAGRQPFIDLAPFSPDRF